MQFLSSVPKLFVGEGISILVFDVEYKRRVLISIHVTHLVPGQLLYWKENTLNANQFTCHFRFLISGELCLYKSALCWYKYLPFIELCIQPSQALYVNYSINKFSLNIYHEQALCYAFYITIHLLNNFSMNTYLVLSRG